MKIRKTEKLNFTFEVQKGREEEEEEIYFFVFRF
jgi:hypothetical protein